jgi:hypothetical protein
MNYYEKGLGSRERQQNESVTNNTSAGSVRRSNYCYVFLSILCSVVAT